MKYSVIIPTYNRENYLKKAVQSVLSQTCGDWELIIIDDGSTDNTKTLISSYTDPRVKYFYQENKGVANARNRAIKESKSEYICPLDSDDWWDKRKLEVQNEYLTKYPEYKIFHTQEIWYKNGQLLPQKEKHKKPSGIIFPNCLPLCCVSISTAVIHKSVFTEIGMFDENLIACEDYDFWLRISTKYPVYLIDTPLTLKDGGRPDQLSNKIAGLDKYRIIALIKLYKSGELNASQKEGVRQEIVKKATIYMKGCIKREKKEEAEYYQTLLNDYK